MSWLTLVGIGADGLDGLSLKARRAIAAAEFLVGGVRHLAMLPADSRQRLTWRSPLADTLPEILALRPRPVAMLATGDPLWYGIGRLLLQHLSPAEVAIVPHVSAFQEACSRLGWALEDALPLTAHGRPVAALRRHFQPGRRLLVLTADGAGPTAIARCLVADGYGESRITVFEEMGGERERRTDATAAALQGCFADLNLVGIDLCSSARPRSSVPGLPDETYEHDGQLTKAEVRAITLASLAPCDGELLWDVGAGAGSVAIEWLRAGRKMRAVAVERDCARAGRIAANAERLGVPELVVHTGAAPAALSDLPAPSAVFVGGGIASPGLLDLCWERLQSGGRLVANAVSISGEAALLAFHAAHGGRLLRLQLARAESIGAQLVWRPAMPVTQLAARK
ncbi:MAG: precorrin-6y C5,15-methyltransferase (decarboxylating) subunit CbiE [Geminicoccaceae bacterium]